ncbi:unnamed protein product [Didymodactylos carnosus]|uniref:NF-kappa-B-activating protein C-terminal domain-containing protein n=1 Tax=Didymodactylos carnosus TaxID=1234261 RepID=A0A814LAH1_9BILA|nr:unnamed protein product [Didymodactylos carnosus]CAF1345682.1 unnamed protein product [Didymodactylos carnosus]CAF3830586.1 unnamed protein product [Didymodactylos carnosus]CAF4156685.1 unnamed protein product [Didymodactylos carnosus]
MSRSVSRDSSSRLKSKKRHKQHSKTSTTNGKSSDRHRSSSSSRSFSSSHSPSPKRQHQSLDEQIQKHSRFFSQLPTIKNEKSQYQHRQFMDDHNNDVPQYHRQQYSSTNLDRRFFETRREDRIKLAASLGKFDVWAKSPTRVDPKSDDEREPDADEYDQKIKLKQKQGMKTASEKKLKKKHAKKKKKKHHRHKKSRTSDGEVSTTTSDSEGDEQKWIETKPTITVNAGEDNFIGPKLPDRSNGVGSDEEYTSSSQIPIPTLSTIASATSSSSAKPVDYGKALLPGEGAAMARFVAEGKRIPRRGEIGLNCDEIQTFEDLGYVMSGSRHRRMEAVRLRKENQIYSADEKRALATFNHEARAKKETSLMTQFKDIVHSKLKK